MHSSGRANKMFITVNLPRQYSSLVPKYDGCLKQSVSFRGVYEMNELNHIKHRYKGAPGEPVTIHVTADGTGHNVRYNLDDVPQPPLPAGTPIRFNLKNS